MARRLISLPEAAGTPEGGKVLGRGSAPMEAMCCVLVRTMQSRLPVSLFPKFTGIVRWQETQHTRRAFCPTLLRLRAAATRTVMEERNASGAY